MKSALLILALIGASWAAPQALDAERVAVIQDEGVSQDVTTDEVPAVECEGSADGEARSDVSIQDAQGVEIGGEGQAQGELRTEQAQTEQIGDESAHECTENKAGDQPDGQIRAELTEPVQADEPSHECTHNHAEDEQQVDVRAEAAETVQPQGEQDHECTKKHGGEQTEEANQEDDQTVQS